MQEFKDLPAGDYTNTPEQMAAATALVSRQNGADLLLRALGLVPDEETHVNPRHYRLCGKGTHRMTPDNVYEDGRKCLECKLEADILAAGAGTKYKLDSHCKNGHERTPENTRIQPDGLRRCIICQQASSRKYTRVRPKRDQSKTFCAHGHKLTEDNVKVDARGARRCLACVGTRQPWTRRKSVDS